jgi:cytochrome c-type biogenesis protein CcmH
MRSLIVALVLAVLAQCAWAKEAAPAADDPKLEQRVNAIAEELRCLVCQNQTLADSHADLAIDLKNQVRERLKAGMSERQILDYMVERYGDFVLYRPPLKATTVFLWIGPFVLLLAGLGVLFHRLSRQRAAPQPRELSESERTRAAALLGGIEEAGRR